MIMITMMMMMMMGKVTPVTFRYRPMLELEREGNVCRTTMKKSFFLRRMRLLRRGIKIKKFFTRARREAGVRGYPHVSGALIAPFNL